MTPKMSKNSKRLLAALLLSLVASSVAAAQATTAAVTAGANQPAASAPASTSGDRYLIGAGDVLSIRVIAGKLVPEFTFDAVEVNGCGMIPLASVYKEDRSEIRASGRTASDLAEELRAFYTKYKRNPQVIVTVKEYNSQPITVIGAVVKPGQFQMRRPVRLLELVQRYAGGKTERAGSRIQLARLPIVNPCEAPAAGVPEEIAFTLFDINETLSGADAANPFLQPGDVVSVLEAKEAYVVGNVLRPGPVLLNEEGITVSRAIAMSGGTMPDTAREKIRIIRQDPKTKANTEIIFDLKAVDKKKAEDLALLPNDIIEVPVSGGRRLLRSLVGTIVPTVGQLPVQVIR